MIDDYYQQNIMVCQTKIKCFIILQNLSKVYISYIIYSFNMIKHFHCNLLILNYFAVFCIFTVNKSIYILRPSRECILFAHPNELALWNYNQIFPLISNDLLL